MRGNQTSASGGGGLRTITHGDQLLVSDVGPWALQGVAKGSEILSTISSGGERISTWPTDGKPSWIPSTPYVYNNDPNNHGGIVPTGGLTIDGEFVPAGAWVVQFRNFTDSLIVTGDNGGTSPAWYGVVFRGCRWRMASPSVGMINNNGQSSPGGKIWVLFGDMGGLSSQTADYCEIPIKIISAAITKRNYLSYCTTAVQNSGGPGVKVIENYIERLTTFNTVGPHINGVSVNGGDECYQVERNHIIAQTPEDNGSGKPVDQTDCIAFFQDFGDYQGTGQNDDGTYGYRVINNYIGGTGYCIYAGMNSGQTATSVHNMYIAGNRVTTQWWPDGGSFGPCAAQPVWGSYGNVTSNNTWADGPNAGQIAF